MIANLGVISGGLLVTYTDSFWLDLIIGLIIATIVVRGGLYVIKEANREKHQLEVTQYED